MTPAVQLAPAPEASGPESMPGLNAESGRGGKADKGSGFEQRMAKALSGQSKQTAGENPAHSEKAGKVSAPASEPNPQTRSQDARPEAEIDAPTIPALPADVPPMDPDLNRRLPDEIVVATGMPLPVNPGT
jgi:hypothetical protein